MSFIDHVLLGFAIGLGIYNLLRSSSNGYSNTHVIHEYYENCKSIAKAGPSTMIIPSYGAKND